MYTVNHKKRDILFLTITFASLNRFLQILYHFNQEEILHATVVKFTTSLYCVCILLRKLKGTLRRRLSHGYFSFIAKYTSN